MRRGFTLIELLVVIAIIAILAAILFPVFARAKKSAQQTRCISNLSQIGKALNLYMTDYDDIFPYAVDASDKFASSIWNAEPIWQTRIPQMPLISEALEPYVKSKEVWKCPADTGFQMLDNHYPTVLIAAPSAFDTFKSSYFFRTEIAFRQFSSSSFRLPSNVNVLFDSAGHWHGSKPRLETTDSISTFFEKKEGFRYNVLFGDFHAKSLNPAQYEEAWSTDL